MHVVFQCLITHALCMRMHPKALAHDHHETCTTMRTIKQPLPETRHYPESCVDLRPEFEAPVSDVSDVSAEYFRSRWRRHTHRYLNGGVTSGWFFKSFRYIVSCLFLCIWYQWINIKVPSWAKSVTHIDSFMKILSMAPRQRMSPYCTQDRGSDKCATSNIVQVYDIRDRTCNCTRQTKLRHATVHARQVWDMQLYTLGKSCAILLLPPLHPLWFCSPNQTQLR